MPTTALLLGILGTVAGAVVTYLVARRQRSGAVATSEAATLWAEGTQMRRELRDEVVALREEVKRLRDEVDTLRRELAERTSR